MSVRPPTTRPSDAPAPGDGPKPAAPWYRRRAPLLAIGVVAVVVVTVLSDIPVNSSKGQEISAERGVMSQINADIGGCALAAHESLEIWNTEVSGSLTASDRAAAPGLLRDDQAACSFTNDSIFQLSDVEVPGSAAGKHLGALVGTATLWATSDALGAIEDLQILFAHPGDPTALKDLAAKEQAAASDRKAALADADAADRILGVRLPAPDLPALPTPKGR